MPLDKQHSNDKRDESPQSGQRNTEEKLCGWLIYRSRGLKASKQRWFQLGEENCKLYYYRHELDLVPIGEITIATATFDFDARNVDKPGQFQIKSDGKDYVLDAGNRQKMFYWLQALQTKRREFNLTRVTVSRDKLGHSSRKQTTIIGGLLSNCAGSSGSVNQPISDIVSDLPEIFVPEPDMGSSSSLSSQHGASTTNAKPPLMSINSFKQTWQSLKLPARLTKESQSQESNSNFYCDLRPSGGCMLLSESTSSLDSTDSLPASDASHVDIVPGEKLRSFSNLSQTVDDNILDSKENTLTSESLNANRALSFGNSWVIFTKQDLDDIQQAGQIRDHALRSSNLLSNVHSKSEGELLNQYGEGESRTRTGSGAVRGKLGQRQTVLDNGKETGSKWVKGHQVQGHIEVNVRKDSGHGKVRGQQGQGQSGVDAGKASRIINTFSNLKKKKFGRRQMSVPNSIKPQVGSVGQGTEGTQKDVGDLQEELNANREIISLLQNRLEQITKKQEAREGISNASDDEKTTMLLERDGQIQELQQELEQANQKCRDLERKLRIADEELKASHDQVTMYDDMLKAKEESLVAIRSQLERDRNASIGSGDQPDVIQSLTTPDSTHSLDKVEMRDIERYKDMCQGYELQHKFLTKEILELNDLRQDDLAREKTLTMNYAKLEAKYYQIMSKYLVLLKQQKEQSPVRDGEGGQEVVSQLLHDALEVDTDDLELRLTGSVDEYDRYGFSRRHNMEETEEETDMDPLINKAAAFERQSEYLNTKVEYADRDASHQVKWENFMVGRGGKLQRCQELKTLIRQGVPHEYREEVWKGCIHYCVGEFREQQGDGYYQSLLQMKATSSMTDPAIKQIELDLLRTLPDNRHYETIESEGILKLRRVLLAFSEHDSQIGYCQGLNRLAAIALLFLSEEDAFWCLVAIVDHLLPQEYFSTTLMAAQADQRVLKDLVREKLPMVHQKLEAHKVDLSLFTFNWFLTVFVDNIPTEMFLRIWDSFLYEGSKVLFRFATAFLKKAEPDILKAKDGLDLNRLLRSIGNRMSNVKQISEYAFNWINPFPMKFLANKRVQHNQDIQVELAELDKIRHGIMIDRANKQQQQDDDCSDED
ncbi:TBC1 domain family member 2B-like [Mya arenaria]|uniref:TBC1 domain family member 2B-like n=1 Tax=Mya arenaria TaxID=6604 RepID=UPI0022E0BF61|nr:TBC1 domain family member 2B-like [Mya arenaria]